MKFLEYHVKCTWCGAEEGEPCTKEDGTIILDMVHRDRVFLYDKIHGTKSPNLKPKPLKKENDKNLQS